MHLFLISAVPISYLYLLVLREQANERSELVATPVLKGALSYLIVLIPLFSMERFVVRPYVGAGLYFYVTIHDFAIPVYLAVLLHLWFTPRSRDASPDERFLSLTSFLTGLFTVAGIMDLFTRAEHFGPYELFYLPALRVALMLLAATLMYQVAAETVWVRYVYLFALLVLPFALGTASFLEAIHADAWAIPLAVLLFLGSWAAGLLASGTPRSLRWR